MARVRFRYRKFPPALGMYQCQNHTILHDYPEGIELTSIMLFSSLRFTSNSVCNQYKLAPYIEQGNLNVLTSPVNVVRNTSAISSSTRPKSSRNDDIRATTEKIAITSRMSELKQAKLILEQEKIPLMEKMNQWMLRDSQ